MRESPSPPWRTLTFPRADLALVLLVSLAAACSSDDQPGSDAGARSDGASADAMAADVETVDAPTDAKAPDGGMPDVAVGDGGDAGTCAPPPPNYPICPAAPCTNDQSPPGCSEVCLVGHCYSCQTNGTWVTEVVDCVRGDAAAPSGG